jgi:NAD+ synthase
MAHAERIAAWMRRQLSSAGARGFIVGLSGGLDSAVVARLAQLAAPGAVLGALLPCHSEPDDETHALIVAKYFAIPITRVDLAATYDTLVASLQDSIASVPPDLREPAITDPTRARLPLANIKPRLRMTTLYAIANRLSFLVAGTSNRSEIAIGYFTKYGDGAADLLPLGQLMKCEVVALARDLNLPPAIIDRTPGAGLWAGQADEAEFGFSYAELERYLSNGPEGVSPALAMRIDRLTRASEHKRALPPMPDA